MTVLACAGALMVAPGCSKRETRTVEQVQRSYAQSMVAGLDFGLQGRVRAKAYDELTFRLMDVSIDAGDAGLIHADYADILVDVDANTISLRLEGVLTASAAGGGMTETDSLTTEPVRLDVDVVP